VGSPINRVAIIKRAAIVLRPRRFAVAIEILISSSYFNEYPEILLFQTDCRKEFRTLKLRLNSIYGSPHESKRA
jgi:hypothetical protein